MIKLIAHRGLKNKFIKENTLESFKDAINNDFYVGFECDIRTSKDHIFVVVHNPIVESDVVSLTKYETLNKKHSILKLEDVLKLNTNKIMLLELKEINVDVIAFQQLIHKYSNKNIYIMSFFNRVISKLANNKVTEKLGVLNYVLNSEESYHNYDFICILESIISRKIEKYFKQKNISIFIYNIHDLDKTTATYKNHFYITDKAVNLS